MKKLIFVPMLALAGIANASCYGPSCTGEDPWNHRFDCPESSSKKEVINDHRGRKIGHLIMKYSAVCHATWSVVKATAPYAWPSSAREFHLTSPWLNEEYTNYNKNQKIISSPMLGNFPNQTVMSIGVIKYWTNGGSVDSASAAIID